MREKLEELARMLEAAKIGTVQVEDQTVYSLENGCNDMWFGVNIKGNHPNHAARRVAAAQAIAGIVNAFPAILEYVREIEADRNAAQEHAIAMQNDRDGAVYSMILHGCRIDEKALAARDAQQLKAGAAKALNEFAGRMDTRWTWQQIYQKLKKEAKRISEGQHD